MGIFGKRKTKCAQCGNTLGDSSEESIRNLPATAAGLLRDAMHLTCPACGKNFCVRCMERAGNHQQGGLPCLSSSCHGQMDTDLPAALPSLRSYLMQMYPDLKAGELEALTRLTNSPLGEATYAIRGILNDETFLELKEKVRTVDPDLAKYLDSRSPPVPRDIIMRAAAVSEA